MKLYCPSCGELSNIENEFDLAPETLIIKCPLCLTTWNIKIDFYEEFKEDTKD